MKHPVRNALILIHFVLLIHETLKKIDMKNFFASKTVWFNLLTGLCTILALIKPDLLQALGLPIANQSQILIAAGTLSSVVNILLRTFSTSQPIGNTAKMLVFLVTLLISANVTAQDTTTKYTAVPAGGLYGNIGFNASNSSLSGSGGIVGYSRYFSFAPVKKTIVLTSLPSYADSTTASGDSALSIGAFYRINGNIRYKVGGATK